MIGNSLAMMAISFLLYMIVCNPNTKETDWKEDACAYSFFAGVILLLVGCILWVVDKI